MQHSQGFLATAVGGLLAAVLTTVLATGPAHAGDPKVGQQKAKQCRVCHGMDGIAILPEAPNLAGDSAMYLETQLKAFRDGTRSNPQMSIIAKGLSDGDIADLAAYFSAIKVTATVPKF